MRRMEGTRQSIGVQAIAPAVGCTLNFYGGYTPGLRNMACSDTLRAVEGGTLKKH